MTSLSAELRYLDAEFEKHRFIGLDQNPKGIRDLLYGTIRKAEALEKELTGRTPTTQGSTKMSTKLNEAIADLIAAQARLTEASAVLIEHYVAELPDAGEPEAEDKKPAKKAAKKPVKEPEDEKPAKKAAKKPVEEPEVDEAGEDDADEKTYTLAEVQKVVIEVSKVMGRDAAKKLIADYTPEGQFDLKAVPEKNFTALYDAAVELTADE